MVGQGRSRLSRFGTDVEDGILWAWIGTHAEYDALT
jgi:hypothetical protein